MQKSPTVTTVIPEVPASVSGCSLYDMNGGKAPTLAEAHAVSTFELPPQCGVTNWGTAPKGFPQDLIVPGIEVEIGYGDPILIGKARFVTDRFEYMPRDLREDVERRGVDWLTFEIDGRFLYTDRAYVYPASAVLWKK